MAKKSIASRIVGKIRNIFSRKPRKPEARVIGHRGVAAGSVLGRQEAGRASRTIKVERRPKIALSDELSVEPGAFSPEEIRKFELLGPGDVQNFVYNQEFMTVHSTNVFGAQYFVDDKKMQVEFLSGGVYLYDNVSPEEAISFAQAPSKGHWIYERFVKPKRGFTKIK